MKRYILYLTWVCAVGLIVSCTKDFIVDDITDKLITINAPANNVVTSENSITFWWEFLDGAEKYNLQVVRPNFASVVKLVLDTIVTNNKFTQVLQPGVYQWRLKALNGGGESTYQVFSFKIDSTGNLSTQIVAPIAPINGYRTNQKSIAFSWNPLPSANNYSLELSVNNSVVHYTTTSGTSYAYQFSLSSAANYTCSWRIRVMNDNSISSYNAPQSFIIDLLAPPVSTPGSPINNALVRDTVPLNWNRAGGTETFYDSLFVYSDASYANLLRTATISVTSLPINQINVSNPLPVGASSLSPIPYWWRLKSVDAQGNTSGFSNGLSFQLYQ